MVESKRKGPFSNMSEVGKFKAIPAIKLGLIA